MRRSAAVVAVLLAAALAGLGGGSARAAGGTPVGFFGIVPQAPLGARDLTRMEGTVETLRIPIYWAECEPTAGHYEFAAVDAEVGAAAAHGIRVMPFVYGTPARLAALPSDPPQRPRALRAWRRFLVRLVDRYGPRGSFWRGHRAKLPIRRWQIWNEPNFRLFWNGRIDPVGYAKLLHVAAGGIRGADPGAKIVLAGVAPVGDGMRTWVFLRRLLAVPGVRRDFDYAAVHPYSATLRQLDFQMRHVHAALVEAGNAEKPLIVSEIGVASQGSYPSAFVVGDEGQAHFLDLAYTRLLRMRHRWRLAGVYWFTWRDRARADVHCAFCQGAGMVGIDGRPKPVWNVFRGIVAAARHGRAA